MRTCWLGDRVERKYISMYPFITWKIFDVCITYFAKYSSGKIRKYEDENFSQSKPVRKSPA
jgi:hypothetical protein